MEPHDDQPAGGATSRDCGRCGQPFICGARTPECWCTSVVVSPVVLDRLTGSYDGCLCPECLEAMSRSPARPL